MEVLFMSDFTPCKKLGFGFMRLPKNSDGTFDMPLVCKMVDAFMERGFNYFDTAYVYEGSEKALSEALVQRYPRQSYTIADKLPVVAIDSKDKLEEFFSETMSRLGVDYIDYYLVHGINGKLNEKAEQLGAWEFIAGKKAQGIVRHMGFSFHGEPEDLEKILDRHPEAEFVQLQINYLDWESDDVKSKQCYEVVRRHNLPVMIMEPVKGGMLCAPESPVTEILRKYNPSASVASWAIRFAASLEGVHVCLSGMNSMEQILDNMSVCDNLRPLDSGEMAVIDKAVRTIRSIPRIQCTGCEYCVKGCPQKIHIPTMMDVYNSYLVYKSTVNSQHVYQMMTRSGGLASSCVQCRSCEEHCPQHLHIVDVVSEVAKIYEG